MTDQDTRRSLLDLKIVVIDLSFAGTGREGAGLNEEGAIRGATVTKRDRGMAQGTSYTGMVMTRVAWDMAFGSVRSKIMQIGQTI